MRSKAASILSRSKLHKSRTGPLHQHVTMRFALTWRLFGKSSQRAPLHLCSRTDHRSPPRYAAIPPVTWIPAGDPVDRARELRWGQFSGCPAVSAGDTSISPISRHLRGGTERWPFVTVRAWAISYAALTPREPVLGAVRTGRVVGWRIGARHSRCSQH